MENNLEIQKVIDSWAKSIRDGDMEGILANHTPDILMYDVIEPFENKGIEEYKKTWETFFKYSKGGDNSFNPTDVKITADENVAFATSTLKIFDLKIRLTLGFVKINGQWLIAHEHHSALGK